MDNTSNNDTLMVSLEQRCEEQGVRFLAREARMRCMPHTVHLAAIKVIKYLKLERTADFHKYSTNPSFLKQLAPSQRLTVTKLQREMGTTKISSLRHFLV